MKKHFFIVVMMGALLLGGCDDASDLSEAGGGTLPPAGDQGSCFYVSAAGDNANDGFTEKTPFKTLVKAYSESVRHASRKKIIVLSSLESEHTIFLTPYILQEKTITIEGKGEGITITRNGVTEGSVLEIVGGANIRIENIRIDGKANGGKDRGIKVTGIGAYTDPQTTVSIGNGTVITGKRTYTDNEDGGSGVMVINGARLVMDDGSAVIGCEGPRPGLSSAIYVYGHGSLLVMNKGASISDNTANDYGGGVLVFYGAFEMNGGKISGNTAADYGGGVCLINGGSFTMNGGTIYGSGADVGLKNTAGRGGAAFFRDGGTTATINGASLDTTDETITVP